MALDAGAGELNLERQVAGGFTALIVDQYKQGQLSLDQARIAMAGSNLDVAKAMSEHPDIFDKMRAAWQIEADLIRACFDLLSELADDHV